MRIDVVKFTKTLTDAGLEWKHAAAIAHALSEAEAPDLATEADVVRLKRDVATAKVEIYKTLSRPSW